MQVPSITASGTIQIIPRVPSDQMKIYRIPYGPFASNMYLIFCGDDSFIVDPSVSPERISRAIDGFDTDSIKAVFITHGHYDHICCADEWRAIPGDASFLLSHRDIPLLSDPRANCSYMDGKTCTFEGAYEDAEGTISFGDLKVTVIATPGHTKGSVCFLFDEGGEKALFTGDTVFAGSVGRTDFPGGSFKELSESVNKVKELDPELAIYPGHGPESTIGEEIRTNPYFA